MNKTTEEMIDRCLDVAGKDIKIATLEGRIKELESGTCRRNCATAKSAYVAGALYTVECLKSAKPIPSAGDFKEAFREWQRQQA